MRISYVAIFMALTLAIPASCKDEKYQLLALSQVHAGRTLQAFLTLYYSSPADVQVKVTKDGSATALMTSTKAVNGDGTPNSFEVEIGEAWQAGDYWLNVTNNVISAGVKFKVATVPYAILIQTDKPIYKPSQTVNIRVAIIDDNLLPRNETITVIIEDAEGNKIQQWKDVQTKMGLTQMSLPLSDRPPLGNWTIKVSTAVVTKEKTIKIDEYVLPRFEVTVSLPSYVLKSSGSLACTVTAKYTFGEDVSGDLSITFSNHGSVSKKGIKIDGSTVVTLNKDDLNEMGLRDGNIVAEASVYEPLSGKTLSGSGSTIIAVSDYLVTFMEVNNKYYRPGQDYICYFDVARPDGQRIEGETVKLKVTRTASTYDGDQQATVTETVPANGMVTMAIPIPSGSNLYRVTLSTQVVLEDGTEVRGIVIDDLGKFQTSSTSVSLYITSNILSVPKVNDVVTVNVVSSKQTGPYTYMVTSAGRVVKHGSGQLSAGSDTFSLTVSQSYTPQAYIVVSAVVNGELLADSISFNVDGVFQNSVSLEFTDPSGTAIQESKPKDNIKVKVNTDAGSTVGVLSVDKSVLLLAGGSDISQSQIITELMSLVETESKCDDNSGGGWRFFWFPTFGGKSTEDILSSAGFSVATDATLQSCFHEFWGEREIMFAMAGNAAPGFDLSAPKSGKVPTAAQRSFFPETWLWNLVESGNGSLVIDTKVPDTITSWVTTALSMNPTSGISVTAQSTQLTVKLPFFINAILPYSAVKGEQLLLKIIVNNYGDADDGCVVTIKGSDQYEAKVNVEDDYTSGRDLELAEVSVMKGGGNMVSAWLNPKVIDTIQLSVTATCTSGASDSIRRDLLIKPPGFPQERCESKFIQIEANGAAVTHVFNTSVGMEYVPDSKRVQVQLTGDVMGPSIEGLDSLVRMPYGCGEQNMVTFTPNIFVRSYLQDIGKLDGDLKTKTTTFMQAGYQRELTYKHTDGSYSAFGNSDPSGSTWLTAFVLKCFRQASEYIEMDDNVLVKAETWLNNQKASSGMFNEPGRVIHADMQGGSSQGITLTAFVVIAMLEDNPSQDLSALSTTITYLENSLSSIESNAYQLSIITYALQLAQSSKADEFLTKLETLQMAEGGLVWWDKPEAAAKKSAGSSYYKAGPSTVETTSYALLTYVLKSDIPKAKPVAMWLIESRSSSGGYFSTQDTVLGLQSLAAYAKLVISSTSNLPVRFDADNGDSFSYTLNAENAILTKKHSFKPAEGVDLVTVTVSGEGATIVTACTGYNVKTPPEKPTTEVTANVTKPNGNTGKVNLKACIKYTGDEADSGMGLTEVVLPTGYSALAEDVSRQSGDMARAESTSNGIAVYWNEITPAESCIVVVLNKDADVKDVQDSYVIGSQYYSTETGSRAFYNPEGALFVDDGTRPSSSTANAVVTTFVTLFAALIIAHFV